LGLSEFFEITSTRPQFEEEERNIRSVQEEVRRLTYRQDWSNYNSAETQEKVVSEALLIELLDSYPKRSVKIGRPKSTLKDRIICMFHYSHSRQSARRCSSELTFAKQRGVISKKPHFNSVLNYYGDISLTPILENLISITSLPLRLVESRFAADSTGFSTSRFDRWFNVRNKKPQRIRQWKKLHITTGTRSNIVTSVVITDGTGGDSPHLVPMAERTNTFFRMTEFSADRAYSSRNNMDSLAQMGAIPYIPFRSNARGNSRGSRIWSLMYDYFHQNQDRFLQSYHRRSNVESTFHMIKSKFGDSLRTKKDASQINEILMKILCHNLAVLVHESLEQGLEIDLPYCAELYLAQQ